MVIAGGEKHSSDGAFGPAVTPAVTAARYWTGMAATSPAQLRVIRGGRSDGDGRQSVDFYRNGTDHVRSVAWTVAQLRTAIRRRRPRRPGDPDWTFSVGRRNSLTITTEGPEKFRARHTTKTADRRLAEIAAFDDLTLQDVERLATAFYADRCDLGCRTRLSS